MPLKSGKLSAAEKQKRQGFIKGTAQSVIPKELENDPVFFTKNIVNFYLELKQRGMVGVASRMITNLKDVVSGGMAPNPKSVLILGTNNSRGLSDNSLSLDWYLTYSFIMQQFVFVMNKNTISNGLLMQLMNTDDERDLNKFIVRSRYMIPTGGPKTTAELISRVENLTNEFAKRTTVITRHVIDNEIEKALIKADVSHTALQSGNMNENFWRVQFSDESLKSLIIKTLWLPKDKKLDLTFNVATDGEYKAQFDKLFTQQERMRALPLNQVAKYVIWFVGAYENSAAELNQQPNTMNQESTVKSFIKNYISISEELVSSPRGIGPEKLEKFKDKFLAVVADDDDKKYKIIKELEQLRDGTVKPGSKLETARNKQYASWASEDFQAMIDHLNSRSLPEEATDTIAEIVLDLAMMHPESDSTKQLLSALETKDFSSNNPVFKVITAHFPPSWKKDDYMDVVKKIVQKSEYESLPEESVM